MEKQASETQEPWLPAGLVALGWMMGACQMMNRKPEDEPPVMALARALKRFGAECDYVDALLAKPQPEAPQGGGA